MLLYRFTTADLEASTHLVARLRLFLGDLCTERLSCIKEENIMMAVPFGIVGFIHLVNCLKMTAI